MVENNPTTAQETFQFNFTVTDPAIAPFTSLKLFNGYNEIVHEGYGDIHIMVPAGLYQLRIEFNEFVEDRNYRIVADSADRFRDAAYQTSSSIPVSGLNNTHEYFLDPSTEWSQKFTGKTLVQPSGNSIFIFFRYADKEKPYAEGISMGKDFLILNNEREIIFRLDGKNTETKSGRESEYYASLAFHQPLKPGQYFLVYKGPTNKCEMPLYVFAGWQTQVFIMFKEGPLFSSTRISIERNQFTANSKENMQLDALIQKMYNGIYFLPDELKSAAASGKWRNPMLGILAAYMYLQTDSKTDDKLYQTILDNLQNNILNDSLAPDLFALRLIGAIHFEREIPLSPLHGPCMIVAGMNSYLRQSLKNENLIKKGSLVEKIFPKLISAGIWTMYEPLNVKTGASKGSYHSERKSSSAVKHPMISSEQKNIDEIMHYELKAFKPEKDWLTTSIFTELSDLGSKTSIDISSLAAQLLVTPNTVKNTLKKLNNRDRLYNVAATLSSQLNEKEIDKTVSDIKYQINSILQKK